jgi:ABC-2 type transport system permease protein
MISQIRVELTRYRGRRAATLLLLAMAVIVITGVAKASWDTRPLTAQDRKDAIAQAQMSAQRSGVADLIVECQKKPTEWLGSNATAEDCAQRLTPDPKYPRADLDLPRLISESTRAIPRDGNMLALLVGAGLIISAAMFAGGPYASGSLATQLTFQPRRVRVWVAKAIAVAVWSLAHAVLFIGAFWLAMYFVADARHLTPSGDDMQTITWHAVRSVVLLVAASVGAFAVTVIIRNTMATLALLLFAVVGGEVLVNFVPIAGAGRWSLANNAMGWLVPKHTYFDATINCAPDSGCSAMQTMSHLQAGSYLLVVLVVVIGVSIWAFRRQDI